MKFFTAVFILSFLLSGNQAFALMAAPPIDDSSLPRAPQLPAQRPESVPVQPLNNFPETTPFQNFIFVPAVPIVVPTVVALPIDEGLFLGSQFLVREKETGAIIGSYYKRVYTAEEQRVTVVTTPPVPNTQFLVDKNSNTSVDFDLPEDNNGSVKISIVVPEGVTTSELRFNLAPNVSNPNTVTVQAQTSNGLKTVVATTQVYGSSVKFPETTANYFEVTFTYVQPLRISEISLIPKIVNQSVDQTLRFLAQPMMSYEVFLNADSSVSVTSSEAGNLTKDEGVLLLDRYPAQTNMFYIPADVDSDGVRDTLDNCVKTFNPKQEDIDRNGRGDACEDFDRDGYMNNVDNCPNNPNYNQRDEDGDGIGDVCDSEESRFTERNKWVPWVGIGMAALVILILFTLVATSTRRKEGEAEDVPDLDSEGGSEREGD
ncbi:thrombospondin type 3 repeat-containing protein [Candidatus Nomurabacteria bacterium]|nr:thrombospondin type 3 repeat-containing protein [Candidatus Kaiserbacteria bacterium]MCB9814717.1 thrombospondin type 3 repeat-containing protein [Candidatus Nomurabacteria bacterium]